MHLTSFAPEIAAHYVRILSTAQSRLSVTLYRKRNAPVATLTLLGASMRVWVK